MGGLNTRAPAGLGFAIWIGMRLCGKHVASEGGDGDGGKDGDPCGEEERSGVEEKRVRRHIVPSVSGALRALDRKSVREKRYPSISAGVFFCGERCEVFCGQSFFEKTSKHEAKISVAPPRLIPQFSCNATHGLRRGLHSIAAPRLRRPMDLSPAALMI